MQAQARTVTSITGAVDETALAADSMLGTIASIRVDTETVAAEIDGLETGFRTLDERFAEMRAEAGDFVARVAA